MTNTNGDISLRMAERYTTKAYDGTTTLAAEQVATLAEVLRLSPSSINSQPWHFTIVGDADTKARLAEASMMNREKVLACSHVIVLRTYRSSTDFEATRIADLHPYAQAYFENNVATRGEAEVVAWRSRQVYIALGVLLATCAEMGIDSTPMEGIDTSAYDTILADDRYTTLVAVAVGRRAEDDPNQPHLTPKKRRTAEDVIRLI